VRLYNWQNPFTPNCMVSIRPVFPIFLLLLVACVEKNPGVQFDFVDFQKAHYQLGEEGHQVNPLHMVELDAFSISTTEVTNAHFQQFIDATGYVTDAERHKNAMTFFVGLDEFEWMEDSTANWRFPFGNGEEGIESKMEHPVTCISYHDALAYCEWAGFRLPTLDEWEAAASTTSGQKVYCESIDEVKNHGNIWLSTTHAVVDIKDEWLFTSPVASYPPNERGIYDLYGNVFEFCSNKPEVFNEYPEIVSARGGSWWCSRHACSFFNSRDIGRVHEHASFANHGFRVVKL